MFNQNYKKLFTFWKNQNYTFKNYFNEVYKNHVLSLSDCYYNKLHLSAYSGLINDPNCLIKTNNGFQIFYQWNPFAPIHAHKHMGYYMTDDFINYYHQKALIEPNHFCDIDGVYSGGAICVNKKNKIVLNRKC